MNQTGFIPILIALVIVSIIGVGAGVYYLGTLKNTNQPNFCQDPITSTLFSLKSALGVSNPLKDWIDEWKDDTGKWVPLKGSELFLQSFDPHDISYYQAKNQDIIADLQPKADRYLQENGFVKNKNNYNLALNSSYKIITTYEKGNLKCLVKYSYANQAYYGCGVFDIESDNLNKQLIAALNSKNDPALYIRVNKIEGNYAFGYIHDNPYGVSYTRGVGWWVAIKENGVWRKIPTGNIGCSVLKQQYSIPQDMNFEGMCDYFK